MARSFPGGTSTNYIRVGAHANSGGACSYALWVYINSLDTTSRRIMDQDSTNLIMTESDASNGFRFNRVASTTEGSWKAPQISTGQWVSVVITHDGTLGQPKIYFDGVSQSITTVQTPVGSYTTASHNIQLGNYTLGNRCIDGSLAEWAFFDGAELTQADATAHSKGISAELLSVTPTKYVDLIRDVYDKYKTITAVISGTSIVNHPRVVYPKTSRVWIPAAAAGGTLHEVTVTDALYIPDVDVHKQDHSLGDEVLMITDVLKTLESMRDADSVLFNSLLSMESSHEQTENLLLSDSTGKDLDIVILNNLYLNDSTTTEILSGVIQLILTDGIVFLEDVVKTVEGTRTDNVLLNGAVIKELERIAQDMLMLLDSVSAGVAGRETLLSILDSIVFAEDTIKEVGLTMLDNVALSLLIGKILEKFVADNAMLSDSATSSIVVGGVIKALVYAAIKSIDILGMTTTTVQNFLGIKTSFVRAG